jgi:hypothetical protein
MVKASLHPAAPETFFYTRPSGATGAERLEKQMLCDRGLRVLYHHPLTREMGSGNDFQF